MITLEDAEKLFPQVQFHFGVVSFLNGGVRPKKIDYEEVVQPFKIVLCGLAEHLCPLLGKLVTNEQILTVCRIVAPAVAKAYFGEERSAQEIVVDIFDDGKNKWLVFTGSNLCYNIATGESASGVAAKPAEAHLYHLSVISDRIATAAQLLKRDKDAIPKASAEVSASKRSVEML